MLKNKKVFFVVSLWVVVLMLTGCFGNLAKHTLTVNLLDKNGTVTSGTVTVWNLTTNKEVGSKEGSTVPFTDLAKGKYKIIATHTKTHEVYDQQLFIDKNQTVTVTFSTVRGSAVLEKFTLQPTGSTQTLTIQDLGANERAIVGVSVLDFSSETTSSYNFGIYLSRVNSGTLQSVDSVALNPGHPKYVYKPVPRPQVRNVKSLDPQLRKVEKHLLDVAPAATALPVFGPADYKLGDKKTFKYQHMESGYWMDKPTTVKAIGKHCYVFADDTASYITQTMINEYAQEFDQIFERNTQFFNDQFDLDQNNKLGIVLIDMMMQDHSRGTVAGYFFGVDFYAQEELDSIVGPGQLYSNEGDFIYINAQVLDPALDLGFGRNDRFGVLAHEFQHELYFYATWANGWLSSSEWVDDTWINEGMSTYAEQLNGYQDAVDSRVYYYFDNANMLGIDTAQESLLCWEQELTDYGISNLFTNYIVEQYGEKILQSIYDRGRNPRDTIELVSGRSFESLFMNFGIANKLHSLQLAPEYSYQYPLEGDPGHTLLTSNYQGVTVDFRPSAIKYYMIEGTGTDVKLEFVGTATKNEKLGVFIYRY